MIYTKSRGQKEIAGVLTNQYNFKNVQFIKKSDPSQYYKVLTQDGRGIEIMVTVEDFKEDIKQFEQSVFTRPNGRIRGKWSSL